jgi:hypothetical protein
MLIAGIDPGKKHLAVCVVDTTDNRIVQWQLLNVDDTSAGAFVRSIRGAVEGEVVKCRRVYIERQPPLNSSMCRVQYFLQMYLEMRVPACEVVIVQAAKRTRYLKARAPEFPGKMMLFDTYAQRKKSSVAFVDHVLATGDTSCDETIRSRFTTAVKRDDYAESFLLAHIHVSECTEEE